MTVFSRIALAAAALSLVVSHTGCTMVPKSQLAQCQAVNRDLAERNRALIAELDNERIHGRDLADQSARDQEELAALQQRSAEFDSERSQLQDQYGAMVDQLKNQNNPLPQPVSDRLSQLASQYPDAFEFDPATGVSKFHADVLFQTGEAEVRPESQQMLQQ
jgi:chemotaxis protein MotB